MADSPLPTSPPEQVVRFGMRTLLVVTGFVAVLAAVAGAFYRRQSPETQHALLIYWTCVAVAAGAGMYLTWRSSWRRPDKAGSILCVLWTTGRAGPSSETRPAVALLALIFWLFFIGLQSGAMATRAPVTISVHVLNGLLYGMMFSASLMIFVPRPFYLCENGVPTGPEVIPWNYIRSAEWTPKNRSVLRLHRLDGDLFVNVPDRMRAGVQKLVAERTKFIHGCD